MKVVILAGGKGTRAYPYTEYMPKPMMPVNGQPIIMQVMRIFAQQGFTDFVISLGWHKDVIKDYFANKSLPWNVELIDTGNDTDTGGRVEKCRDVLGEKFFVTYSDGLSDVPLEKLVEFHDSHGGLASVTSVPLVSQYGTIDTDEHYCIRQFREKPVLPEHMINAGFFIFDKSVFDHWAGTSLERHVLPNLAHQKLIYAYRHKGFFKSMDTHKDQQEIEQMCAEGQIPWLVQSRTAEPVTR